MTSEDLDVDKSRPPPPLSLFCARSALCVSHSPISLNISRYDSVFSCTYDSHRYDLTSNVSQSHISIYLEVQFCSLMYIWMTSIWPHIYVSQSHISKHLEVWFCFLMYIWLKSIWPHIYVSQSHISRYNSVFSCTYEWPRRTWKMLISVCQGCDSTRSSLCWQVWDTCCKGCDMCGIPVFQRRQISLLQSALERLLDVFQVL